MSRIDLVIIATGKYIKFVTPLVHSVKKFFMIESDLRIHLFSDQACRGVDVIYTIPSYKFPQATLYRYKIFNDHRDKLTGDYIFYVDVDSRIIGVVNESILDQGLIVTRHPGFHMNNGWGSPGCDERSLAWLPRDKWKAYYCGGFQGGDRETYLTMCSVLAKKIDNDEQRGVRAVWHDETFLNWYINSGEYQGSLKVLSPSYMMPQQRNLRRAWGLDKMEIKIIALEKNHVEIRS